MEERYSDQVVDDANALTFKDHLNKYLNRYPLFVASLIICLTLAFLYIRYTIPKYKVQTQILLKGNFPVSSNNASKDLIETALSGNTNVNNELQLLQSVGLMERVVKKNAFNIMYYKVGNVLDLEVYRYVPFRLVPQGTIDSTKSYSLSVKELTKDGGLFEPGSGGNEKLSFRWFKPFVINGQSFILAPNGPLNKVEVNYRVVWKPVEEVAGALLGSFYAAMLDNKTSIIDMNMVVENLDKGKAVLDAICREYILASMEEKSQLASNAIQFIDDRLEVVARELGGVEGNLEEFKSSNRITNVDQQSSTTFDNANALNKDILEIKNQQVIVEMITTYVSNPDYRNKLVPSTLGLSDATLSSMVNRYNELQMKKEKEAPYVQSENEMMKDLSNQINGVRVSILESLNNIERNLQLRENSLARENSKYQQILSSIPRKERLLQDIERKQSITEGLYLYLLQKREEVAISTSTSVKPDYKQIDEAKGYGPVEPNTKKVWIISIIAGLLLPVLILYVQNFLNDKVSGRNDVTQRINWPVMGEVDHINNKKFYDASVDNSTLLAEQFRTIRTNLSLLPDALNNKVLLVTSAINKEGKSFICANLAKVLAIPGKQVALLNFDLRKNVSDKPTGKNLANFLSGDTRDLSGLYQASNLHPSLHLFNAFGITGNPSDLLLNTRMPELLTLLRSEYDFVVIDSPPLGAVSDALILGKYADVILVTVRQGFTPRKKLQLLTNIFKNQDQSEKFIILNDVTGYRSLGQMFRREHSSSI